MFSFTSRELEVNLRNSYLKLLYVAYRMVICVSLFDIFSITIGK